MEGLNTLKQYIKNAPQMPGVYRMLNKEGKVLYVGKAKNIQKRITSYSHIDKLPVRLQRMVSQIHSMEFIVVKDEKRALLLENELIKKLEPKYNILLKDDKSFPFLAIDLNSDYPLLKKMRGKKNKNDKIFGPFASVSDLNSTIDTLQKLFMLRSCTDSVFNNRSRPCFLRAPSQRTRILLSEMPHFSEACFTVINIGYPSNLYIIRTARRWQNQRF